MGLDIECIPILWCPECKKIVEKCTICNNQILLGEKTICPNEPEDWSYHCHKLCSDKTTTIKTHHPEQYIHTVCGTICVNKRQDENDKHSEYVYCPICKDFMNEYKGVEYILKESESNESS